MRICLEILLTERRVRARDAMHVTHRACGGSNPIALLFSAETCSPRLNAGLVSWGRPVFYSRRRLIDIADGMSAILVVFPTVRIIDRVGREIHSVYDCRAFLNIDPVLSTSWPLRCKWGERRRIGRIGASRAKAPDLVPPGGLCEIGRFAIVG